MRCIAPATVLLSVWAALACAGGQSTDDAPGMAVCFGRPAGDDSPAPPDARDRYEYDGADIVQRALGRWEGRYPGGDLLGPFDIVVDITRPNPEAAVASFGYADPDVQDPMLTERCMGALVEAEGTITLSPALEGARASDEAVSSLSVGWLAVAGTTLRTGAPDDDPKVPGQVLFEVEEHLKAALDTGEASGEVDLSFVFSDHNELWVSAKLNEGTYDFKRSGERVRTATFDGGVGDGG